MRPRSEVGASDKADFDRPLIISGKLFPRMAGRKFRSPVG
jgi:hypothetical protein